MSDQKQHDEKFFEQCKEKFIDQELCKIHRDPTQMITRQIHEGFIGSMMVATCLLCEEERAHIIANPEFIIPA